MIWTTEEEALFQSKSVKEISEITGRSMQSVYHKRYRLMSDTYPRDNLTPVPEPLSAAEKLNRLTRLCREMRVRIGDIR